MLSELRSQGQRFYAIDWSYPNGLGLGDRGNKVRHLQYMLSLLSAYIEEIPSVSTDGIYGADTENAVRAAQSWFGLPVTGITDSATWDEIYDQFSGIENATLRNAETFPSTARSGYNATTTQTQSPGRTLQTGDRDPISQEVVR